MQKFGLALGGGGTKGAYHIGVWNALCELGIEVCAICGTSIGSINGAVIAQGDGDVAARLWENISVDNVVQTNGIENVGNNLLDAKSIVSVLSYIHKNNGLETEPLKNLINNVVDEKKLRNSDIDFGLVTCELDGFDTLELFLDEIPEGKLTDYIMASSGMPGLKRPVIDDKKYLDGGFTNNIPANMLIKRGITDIITVDVGGIGIVKDVPKTGINHINIKCSENIIGLLDFDEKNISKTMKLGYFDCLKAFGRTMGNIYSFNPGDYHKSMGKYSGEILSGLEKAAKIYSIDNLKIYKVNSLIDGVIASYEKYTKKYLTSQQGQAAPFDNLKIDDKQILTRIISYITENKSDPSAIKFIPGIKDIITAANAVAYFIKKQK